MAARLAEHTLFRLATFSSVPCATRFTVAVFGLGRGCGARQLLGLAIVGFADFGTGQSEQYFVFRRMK